MSGPCLSSSVAGHPLRPATRRSLGRPLPHQLTDRPRANLEAAGPEGSPPFSEAILRSPATYGINPPFGGLSHSSRHVAHVILTRSPLETFKASSKDSPFDLHVLSTPPAFILSQNQTLHKKLVLIHRTLPESITSCTNWRFCQLDSRFVRKLFFHQTGA